MTETRVPTAPATPPAPRLPTLSKRQKAAILIRLLLKEGAKLDLDDLPEAMQVDLTHEMGALRMVDRATLDAIVTEFLDDLSNLGASFGGGVEGALELLGDALSEETVRRLRRETGLVVRGDAWTALAALDGDALAAIAARESDETMAVVVSKLPASKSAEMLARLDPDRARDIAQAVTTTAATNPDTVATIGHALAAQMAEETPRAFEQPPVARIGEILNNTSAMTRDGVLDALDASDADLGAEVRREIFTFNNIADRVATRDIPKVVRAVDQTVLLTAMKGASAVGAERSVAFILGNMSQRMAGQLREELEEMGDVPGAKGEVAMADVVGAIRDMQAAGEITLTIRADPDDAAE